MAIATQTMTDQQRKAVALEYLDPDYAGKDTARYPWLEGQAGA